MTRKPSLGCTLLLLASALAPRAALAQMGAMGPGARGMTPGGGPGGPGPAPKEEEQAAEAAPENPAEIPALQPLPAFPGQQEKKLQFIELHGYMRGRAYLFHNLSLGVPLSAQASSPIPPFFVPFSEFGASGMASNPGNIASCAARTNSNCTASNITSADMRLRLEPIVTVTDQVKVYAMADVFDNLVAGSTPDGFFVNGLTPPANVPVVAFTRTQVTPIAGVNALQNSIQFKRAWAEVKTPIGLLSFGRMPSQWGMGMFVNNGNCLDCDFGVNVDRIQFATKLWNHFFAVMYDWAATGPTTALFNPNQIQGVQFNADPLDDVWQIGFALGRRDDPGEIRERVERGKAVFNYGGYFVYRAQSWDETPPLGGTTGVLPITTPQKLGMPGVLVNRGAWAFIPDLWFRLNWRKLQIELEGTLVVGKIGSIVDVDSNLTQPLNILMGGGVIRGDYKFLHDSLHVGMEVGYASGDPGEDKSGRVNFQTAVLVRPPSQTTISNFAFDPDYHVDLILFRRIIGTVTNATYFKPNVIYDILDTLSARVDIIYSLANVPVAYPGNAVNLGLELDGSVMYHNEEEGFYAGVAYGVLFPFAALSLPGANCDAKDTGGCQIYGPGTAHTAETAQTVQARVVVKF
jgi:uncharacterized protein (TIGR04551 family)